MRNMTGITGWLLSGALLLGVAMQAHSQTPPTKDQLASDNNLFLSLARKALKW